MKPDTILLILGGVAIGSLFGGFLEALIAFLLKGGIIAAAILYGLAAYGRRNDD